MDDLGFDVALALPWFPHEKETPYVLVRVGEAHVGAWADTLAVTIRRCYVTDALLEARAKALNVPKSDILSARLPDPGATMAGDFGEILAYLYQAVREHPAVAFGPKKWRLKQDRSKPAPYSDVVQFVLPTWPAASEHDLLLCCEVKTKSTAGRWAPIEEAIRHSAKDRAGRLRRTLVWLRERSIMEDLGDVTVAHLDRFINATDHPPAEKRFRAVAIVHSRLVEKELEGAPRETASDYAVVVIAVPDLQSAYTSVFESAHTSVLSAASPARERQ